MNRGLNNPLAPPRSHRVSDLARRGRGAKSAGITPD